MQQITNNLTEWRKSRNITEVNLKIKDDLLEEYQEAVEELAIGNIEKYLVELSDICIFGLNWLGLLNVKYKNSPIDTQIPSNKDKAINALMDDLLDSIEIVNVTHFTGTAFLIKDIIDVCFCLAELYGYSMEKVILEKIKVINSREQDPTQKEEWKEFGAKGKWLKNKDQDPNSIYVGDFDKCKV